MFVLLSLIPQTGLQIFLVVIAMLSVPVLLLGKPLYLYWLYRGGKGLRRRRVSVIEDISQRYESVSCVLVHLSQVMKHYCHTTGI